MGIYNFIVDHTNICNRLLAITNFYMSAQISINIQFCFYCYITYVYVNNANSLYDYDI